MGFLPHMHFRGSRATYEAFYPDGSSEILLDVPQYDYNWQVFYDYKEPKRLPAGTRLEVTMYYNNSDEYAALYGKINPNRVVRYGGPTSEEMMNGWIDSANTIPKDFDAEMAGGATD